GVKTGGGVSDGISARVKNPWTIVRPNGLSRSLRSTSTWIHWWSPVRSANWSTISWVMVTVGPHSPNSSLTSAAMASTSLTSISGMSAPSVRRPGPAEVEGDIDDHVFLSADQPAAADLDEDAPHVDAVALRCRLGVPEEARVHPGVPEAEGLSVDPDRTVLDRSHQLLGGVLEGE